MRIRQALGAALATAALAAAVAPQAALAAGAGTQDMYRLYNPYSGEHFYTASATERDHLDGIGWNYEGVGWVAPEKSGTPVYRLYNRYAGDHHYTTSASERDALVRAGWTDEGVGWYSDDAEGVALLRQYNPYARTGTRNYTASEKERDHLVGLGWHDEGVGWYGVGAGSEAGDAASPEDGHDHVWHPVYSTRTVVDKEAWDEPVYKTVTMYRCNGTPEVVEEGNTDHVIKPHVPCGQEFTSGDSDENFYAFERHNDAVHNSEASYTNYDKKVQVGTKHHDAVTHQEEYVSGYRCAKCGVMKQD